MIKNLLLNNNQILNHTFSRSLNQMTTDQIIRDNRMVKCVHHMSLKENHKII